ncbi:Protein F09E5.3 [Aphelenchoides avenae]|nr:Protein F09E5.3 [Aphelenchus avenae]
MALGFEALEEQTKEAKFDDLARTVEQSKQDAEQLAGNKDELKKLVAYIDLTTLSGDDTRARVQKLAQRALEAAPGLKCGAVCVYPARVKDVAEFFGGRGERLPIASVAGGFPSGQYRIESRLLEIELAVKDGATEIDTVINRAAALDGDWKTVYEEVKRMKEACGATVHLKTILATGELETPENVYKASWAAMLAGSHFIKTSTGKETVNASLEVAFVMLTAIAAFHKLTGHRVGFKPAGGIRTASDALQYRALVERVLGRDWLTPELFRIGASGLLDDIVKQL